jgi:hypothetical protein
LLNLHRDIQSAIQSDSTDLASAVASLVERARALEEQNTRLDELLQSAASIANSTPTELPGTLESLLAERQRFSDILSGAKELFDCEEDSEIIPNAREFREAALANSARHNELTQQLRDILGCTEDGELVPAVSRLQNILRHAKELMHCPSDERLIPAIQRSKDDASAETKRLEELLRDACSAAGCSLDKDLSVAIQELREKLRAAERLFGDFMELLTGSHIDIEFPLSEDKRGKLLAIIQELRATMESSQATLQAVFSRALHAGYTGADVMEAIDALEVAAVANEQHASSERLRAEVEDLRSVMQRQQELSERQSGRQKEKIEQQNRLIQDLREKNTQLELAVQIDS